ncbi:MAG: hypothetical protein ACOZB0_01295 [Pseudomonadota bacterium]
MATLHQVAHRSSGLGREVDFSPEMLAQARSRVERVVRAARSRNPDTVLFLTMTELQQLFPGLTDIELSGLYRAIQAQAKPGEERGLA